MLSQRLVRRLVLMPVLVCLGLSTAAVADGKQSGVKIKLASPSPSDVTYGAAQLKIFKKGTKRKTASRNLAKGQLLIQQVGGVDIVAQSAGDARKLRRAMKIYVVVTPTRKANSTDRNFAIFVARKRTKSGVKSNLGSITFTIGNAKPLSGSYFVRGTDKAGFTRIFNARNIVSTALGNWSRYLKLLKAKNAIAAAMKAVDINSPEITDKPSRATTASRRSARTAVKPTSDKTVLPGPWTGGDRMSNATLSVYGLIFGTIGNRSAYQAAKKEPVVAEFIKSELNNPNLATRWTSVVNQRPLVIPERYAAAAKEERRFGAPKGKLSVSRRFVQIADDTNSSSQAAKGFPFEIFASVHTGEGTVKSLPTGSLSCTNVVAYCYRFFPENSAIQFVGIPNENWLFDGWLQPGVVTNCIPEADGSCIVESNNAYRVSGTNYRWAQIMAIFSTMHLLTVTKSGSGSGSVTSDPSGIDCGASCSASFKSTKTVTLTATPDAGSRFTGWSGCGSSSGSTCAVEMKEAKTVVAGFEAASTSSSTPTTSTASPSGPTSRSFSNTNQITFASAGAPSAGSPYPSTITVSDMLTQLTNVTVSLDDFTDTIPGYAGVKLVGPQGQHINLMYLQGSNTPVINADLTFTDLATAPVSAPVTSGSYRPSPNTSPTFLAPAPPAESSFSFFNNTNPNGTWSLYVEQIQPGGGSIEHGWVLNLTSQ